MAPNYNDSTHGEATWRLIGGMEGCNRLVPHPPVADKNQEDTLAVEVAI